MYVGLSGSIYYIGHGDLPTVVPVGNVVSNGCLKQHRLLGHDPQLGPQPREVHVTYVLTIQFLKG